MERRRQSTRSCRQNAADELVKKTRAAKVAAAAPDEDAATNRSNGSSSSKENVATRRSRTRRGNAAAAADGDDSASVSPRKKARLAGAKDSASPDAVANRRRNIKRIMLAREISKTTKEAQVAERERLRRIAERQKQQQQQQRRRSQRHQEEESLVEEADAELKEDKAEEQAAVSPDNRPSPRAGRKPKSPPTAPSPPLVLERAPDTGAALVDVAPRVSRQLKLHQSEAVQFLYDCLYESVEETRRGSSGSGALLAHCMGLGKSLSVIAFLHAVMRRTSQQAALGARSALIVCPLNVALNWANEFRMWLGDEAAQRRCGEEPLSVRELTGMRLASDRLAACRDFIETGGVLIVNYDMFRNLVQGRSLASKRKQREIYRRALLDPGPDIVVCDEGHVLKSCSTGLSKAMTEIRTKRRIVLTGTPLQNNLMEYYTMVSFVKPSLLGTQKEFANRFVNPINNGQHSDSTAFDVQLMKRRAHVLHRMLSGCVHRRDYTALTKYLPPKHEFIINVRLGELQEQMYRKYLDQVRPLLFSHSVSLFADQQVLYRVWTHPHLLKLHEDEAAKRDRWTSSDEDDEEDEDNDETESKDEDADGVDKHRQGRTRRSGSRSSSEEEEDYDSESSSSAADSSSADEVIANWGTRTRGGNGSAAAGNDDDTARTIVAPRPPQWWHPMYTKEMADDVSLSGKLHILFSLLRSFEEHADKTLVFSQSLLSLDIIEHFIDKLGLGQLGEDYLRLDGSTPASSRKAMSEAFNKERDRRLRLFLISTKAGGLGVNLPAANRVVIFDVSWNPSHDIQSIFRTYRFGQTKPVFVYRLVAQGTMEEKIYSRQVNKQSLGFRVVDEHQINRHFTAADLVQLYTLTVDRFDPNIDARKRFDLPADDVLADLLAKEARWIASYHLHDSLLENVESELLTDEERQQAWQEYEQEKHSRPRFKQQQQRLNPGEAEDDQQAADSLSPHQQLMHSASEANLSVGNSAQPPSPMHFVASSAALLHRKTPPYQQQQQQLKPQQPAQQHQQQKPQQQQPQQQQQQQQQQQLKPQQPAQQQQQKPQQQPQQQQLKPQQPAQQQQQKPQQQQPQKQQQKLQQQQMQPKPAVETERQQILSLQRQYPLQFLNIRLQISQQRPELADNAAELDRLAYRFLLDWLRKQQEQRQQKQAAAASQ